MLPDLDTRLQRHAAQLETMAPVIDMPEVLSMATAEASPQGLRVPVHIGHRKAVIALAILALGLIAAAVSFSLRSGTVDTGPQLGRFMEIEIAPDGLPFLTYSDGETGGTIFAKCADRFCGEDTTYTRFDGFFPTVLMRVDGRPLIWIDGPDGTELGPWLLDCANPACSEYTTTEISHLPSQVVDVAPSGRTLLTYWDAAGDIVIATCPIPTCATEMAEVSIAGSTYGDLSDAVLLDDADRPVMLFASTSELRLVRCRVPDCSTGYDDQSVPTAYEVDGGTPIDVVIDDEDRPWIAYGRHKPMIVRCHDRTCAEHDTVPLGQEERAWQIATLLGVDGLPMFIYNWTESLNEQVLKVARCTDADCAHGTIATVHRSASVSSVVATLGPAGAPVIAHRSEQRVILTECADAGCTDGALEVTHWDHSVPPTTTTTFTTTTVVGPSGDPGGWSRVVGATEAFGPSATITDALGRGEQVIAVGQDCAATTCHPTAWVSTDARSWTATKIADHGDVSRILDGPGGLVAILQIHLGDDEYRTEIWRSADGTAWNLAEVPSCLPAPSCRTWRELSAGSGAGYAVLGMRVAMDQPTAELWSSPDGINWSVIDLEVAEFDEAVPNAAWALHDRLVVQVNTCNFDEVDGQLGTEACRKRHWTSTDAVTWTENVDDEMVFWLHQPHPFVWSGGAAAFGYWIEDDEWIPKLWTSPDGLEWTVTDLEGAWPNTVVELDDQLFGLAAGHDQLEDRERAFMFTSSDGQIWTVDEQPAEAVPSPGSLKGTLTTLGDTALLIGEEIWRWRPAG